MKVGVSSDALALMVKGVMSCSMIVSQRVQCRYVLLTQEIWCFSDVVAEPFSESRVIEPTI